MVASAVPSGELFEAGEEGGIDRPGALILLKSLREEMAAVLPLQVLVRTGGVGGPHQGQEEQGFDEQVRAQVLADRRSGDAQARVVHRGEVAVSLAGAGGV